MSNKKNIMLTIALILIIALSSLLFFGIGSFSKTNIQITSFIFIILAEIITYCNALLLCNKKLNTFAKAGLSSTTILYLISIIFINIIFSSLFTTLKSIIVANLSLFVIYLLIDTIIMFFKKEV